MLEFSVEAIPAIEALFDQQWPGEWRRLRAGEDRAFPNRYDAGWRLDVPTAEHCHPLVDHIWIFVDSDFPFSQVRVVAPGAGKKDAPPWPHVEGHGLLCLKASAMTAEPSRRVVLAISDAINVLSMDGAVRRAEFEREFASYWNRSTTQSKNARSIVTPGGTSRIVVYTDFQGAALFADNQEALNVWLTNAGVRNVPKGILTYLIALSNGPEPSDFPSIGADVIRLAGPNALEPLFTAPNPLPVLLEVSTLTGTTFGCVTLNCEAKKQLSRGFRTFDRVTAARIITSYTGQRVSRLPVLRMDRGWIHGRDRDLNAATLFGKSVTIIGCGALGSEMARLLAEAGVGQFYLVDDDTLTPQNTSRHLLGAADVDRLKAKALADNLARAFPHMKAPVAVPRRFELLTPADLSALARSDLIITAGLSVPANIHVSQWRNELPAPPLWVCCWTEEFACAGHAVALDAGQSVLDLIDNTGRPRQRLTRTWPRGVGTMIEAGCGNAFQPYGAVDMLGTVGVSTRLAVEMLLGKVTAPAHRIWMGSRDLTVEKGAELSDTFNGSYQEGTLL